MYNDLDIVFLGGLFPKETEEEIIRNSKNNIQNAANNLQWEFVMGLNANLEQKVRIINSLYIGSFPRRYKRLFIDSYTFSQSLDNTNNINVGFLNITGLKMPAKYFSLKPYLKEWAESKTDRKKIVIAYAMSFVFTHLLRYIKKINNEVKTCMIVPDLPQYMNLSNQNSRFRSALKDVEIRLIESDMKYIDSYVLLTKHMNEALQINVPSVVVEGISTDIFKNIQKPAQQNEIKTFFYFSAAD